MVFNFMTDLFIKLTDIYSPNLLLYVAIASSKILMSTLHDSHSNYHFF